MTVAQSTAQGILAVLRRHLPGDAAVRACLNDLAKVQGNSSFTTSVQLVLRALDRSR